MAAPASPGPSLPQPPAVTLASLAEALQAQGLLAYAHVPDPLARVSGVTLRDAADSEPVPAGSLVLAAGVRGNDEARLLARQCAEAGSVLAIRAFTGLRVDSGPAGDAGPGALLALRDNTALLTALEIAQRHLAPDALPGAGGRPGGARDLFEIADLAAAAAGGPVTIEDDAGTLVGYSRDQHGGDDVRVATIVSRRSPEDFTRALAASGVPRLLARTDGPVVVSDVIPGAAPRVAMALREGGVRLGVMWALTGSLDDVAREEFTSLARAAVAQLLQRRNEENRARAVELEHLAVLLHGGAAMSAAVPVPSGASAIAVLDFLPADITERAVLGARLDQRLLTLPQPPELTVLSGQLSGLLYLILSVTDVRRNVMAVVEAWLLDLITDRAAGRLLDVRVGVGRPVLSSGDLPRSRREAEHALAVAKSRGQVTAPVFFEHCWAQAVLLRILDATVLADLEALTPVRLLRSHDAEHGTEHIRTLRAWLRHQGNIRSAAEALHIHPNTFRYRMERLREAAPIDIDDPDVRLVLELQLRGTA